MIDRGSPTMSVVLVTPDRYETIRKTMEHLRAQTIRDRLEIVIVAPSRDRLELDHAELECFCQFRLVEVGKITSTGVAIAAGIRQASAPVVVYVEEHSYPGPGWAEPLIEAHRQSWAAVGPAVYNANPGTMTSWAHLFLNFGAWVEPATAGVATALPSHQSAYKRALLLDYGPELETMLESESDLQRDLLARGYRFYLEPAAKTCHVNISLPSSFLRAEFHGYRVFGANRARYQRWSPLRRLLYISGGPLIPLVRLARIMPEIRRCSRQRNLLPQVLPVLFLGLAAGLLGELAGYIFGAGNARSHRANFELNRFHYLTERDGREQAGV